MARLLAATTSRIETLPVEGLTRQGPYKLTYVRGHSGLLVMVADEMQVT